MAKEATGRRYVDYVVLEVETDGFSCVAVGLADTRAGRRWIQTDGEDGRTYQVAALTTHPLTVRVEQVEKRRLEGPE